MEKFSFSEKTAVTIENGQVEIWSANGTGAHKVFANTKGDRAVLRSDEGYWWRSQQKSAPYCKYAQYWMGDFPWGSWCWAIRVGEDLSASITSISTDINPSGPSTADRWERECKTWVPDSLVLS